MAIKSPAKNQVLHFIRTTPPDGGYVFNYIGSETDAKKFMQNMSTELSRLRTLYRKRNKKEPDNFRMVIKSMEIVGPNKIQITLIRKTKDYQVEIPQDVQDVIDLMGEE